MRDFVQSRVVGGIQQIRVHVTLHTNGEQVLWPYGYTKTNLPPDMTRDDHRTFVALGRAMAARNGYTPMQSSDLYVTDGDQIDWMYGRHRIFSFTLGALPDGAVERRQGPLQPRRDHRARDDPQPLRAAIHAEHGRVPVRGDRQVGRELRAVLRRPRGLEGLAGQPRRHRHVERRALAAGQPAAHGGEGAEAARRDGLRVARARHGRTRRYEARVERSRRWGHDRPFNPDRAARTRSGRLTFRYYLAHGAASSADDWLRVWVEAEDGTRTLVLEELGASNDDDAAWASASVALDAWAGQSIRLVVGAADGGRGNLVEAAIDDVRIRRP